MILVNSRIFGLLLFLALAGLMPSISADERLIPEGYSSISLSRFTEGIVQADKFRRELLRRGISGQRKADVLARACLLFREKAASGGKDLVSLKKFRISEKQIVRAIEGSKRGKRWHRTFEAFRGKWYGKWDKMVVDHHWYPVQTLAPRIRVPGFHDVYVASSQFAWVGDGFGWNVIASEEADERKVFVLGAVYHVDEGDPLRVRLYRPHIGVICSDQRMLWMTRKEVFFEEKFDADEVQPERYAITGFRYRFNGGRIQNEGNAFQAIYTRKQDNRPEWRDFWVGIVAE